MLPYALLPRQAEESLRKNCVQSLSQRYFVSWYTYMVISKFQCPLLPFKVHHFFFRSGGAPQEQQQAANPDDMDDVEKAQYQ